jgi:hypothetical protein
MAKVNIDFAGSLCELKILVFSKTSVPSGVFED